MNGELERLREPMYRLPFLLAVAAVAGCGGLASTEHAGTDAGVSDVTHVDAQSVDAKADGPSTSREASSDGGLCVSGPACTPACDEGVCCRGRCVVTLASNQEYPSAIAVDSRNVYWANAGERPSGSGTPRAMGTIMSVPIAGGTPVTLASGQAYPVGIAVDGDDVYWTNQGYPPGTLDTNVGTVMQVPRGGGVPITLAAGQPEPQGIAVAGSVVVWTLLGPIQSGAVGPGLVLTVPVGGGDITTVATTGPATAVASSPSGNAYWACAAGIESAPLDGGPIEPVTPRSMGAVWVALDATSVYWTTHTGALKDQFYQVMRTPIAGGATVPLNTVADDAPIGGIAALPLPLAPGEKATHVYFTGACSHSSLNTWSGLCRVAPDGEGLTTLFTEDADFGAVAVDATSVYWAEPVTYSPGVDGVPKFGPGRIMRLTPR
jgi:hypothetical protein